MFEIKANCTCCGTCVALCKKSCLKICSDDNGFIKIDFDPSMCIDCNNCSQVCHLNVNYSKSTFQQAYAAVNKDVNDLNRAASGGAFSAIAKYVLSCSGIVYGCAYDHDMKACHIRVSSIDNLFRLNGSKYVQSNIGNSYESAKKDLESGKLVLFSGTPCQIAGLNAFLGKSYENLITADIVCHGVAPQAFFDKYIRWYEKKHKCHMVNYDFRNKANSGWSLAGICTVLNGKNELSSRRIFYYNEFYYYFFLTGKFFQESCYECKYANLNRTGDFSLGDMWGAESVSLPFAINKGCSLIIANSKKAKDIIPLIDLDYSPIEMDVATRLNKQLVAPSRKNTDYYEFVKWYNETDADIINKSFKKTYRSKRLIGYIKYHTPQSLKRILRKIR